MELKIIQENGELVDSSNALRSWFNSLSKLQRCILKFIQNELKIQEKKIGEMLSSFYGSNSKLNKFKYFEITINRHSFKKEGYSQEEVKNAVKELSEIRLHSEVIIRNLNPDYPISRVGSFLHIQNEDTSNIQKVYLDPFQASLLLCMGKEIYFYKI